MQKNKKIKVLFGIYSMHTSGGLERVITNLANQFTKDGMQVYIAVSSLPTTSYHTLDKKIKITSMNISIESKGPFSHLFFLFLMLIRLYRIINNISPSIIIGTDEDINGCISIYKTINKNILCIGTEHMHPPKKFQSRLISAIRKILYRYLSATVFLTEETNKYMQTNYKLKLTKVIANPIIFPIINSGYIVNPADIINVKKFTLLAVGWLVKRKGFHLLIPIFNNLIKNHDNWQLVILGEGEQRLELEQQINKLELKNKVYMPGSVGNIADWYEIADLFGFSSRYEGFGCALAEAMSYEVPAVSFDCQTGPRDIIRHGIDGLLVNDGNTVELEQSLDKLMFDKKLRQQFANKAIDVRDRFKIKNITNKWYNLFDELDN